MADGWICISLPKNQPFLTIGRSTNNNMTLRYRTVSQLHAKIKYQNVRYPMSHRLMLYSRLTISFCG